MARSLLRPRGADGPNLAASSACLRERLRYSARTLGLLIENPWLALVAAGAFAALFALRRSKLALVTALLWAGYFLYEMGMKLRILCSGECNIRVDLLLIYPVLLVVSVAAIVTSVRKPRPAV